MSYEQNLGAIDVLTKEFVENMINRFQNENSRNTFLNAYISPKKLAIDLSNLNYLEADLCATFLTNLLSESTFRTAIKDETLFQPITEQENIKDKTLTKLRKIKSAKEDYEKETGINTCAVGYPLLELNDGNKKILAPLIIWQLDILKNKKDNTIELNIDDNHSASFNKPLLKVLETTHNIELDKFKRYTKNDIQKGIIDLIKNLSKIIEANDTDLDEYNKIGNIPNKKDNSLENKIINAGILTNFKNTNAELIYDLESIKNNIDSIKKTSESYKEIINSIERNVYFNKIDGAQNEIINEFNKGHNLIIQGPPGTGKSHTIEAMVYEALESDKKILVVCAKKTALDVVYNKIKENVPNLIYYIKANEKKFKKPEDNVSISNPSNQDKNTELDLLLNKYDKIDNILDSKLKDNVAKYLKNKTEFTSDHILSKDKITNYKTYLFEMKNKTKNILYALETIDKDSLLIIERSKTTKDSNLPSTDELKIWRDNNENYIEETDKLIDELKKEIKNKCNEYVTVLNNDKLEKLEKIKDVAIEYNKNNERLIILRYFKSKSITLKYNKINNELNNLNIVLPKIEKGKQFKIIEFQSLINETRENMKSDENKKISRITCLIFEGSINYTNTKFEEIEFKCYKKLVEKIQEAIALPKSILDINKYETIESVNSKIKFFINTYNNEKIDKLGKAIETYKKLTEEEIKIFNYIKNKNILKPEKFIEGCYLKYALAEIISEENLDKEHKNKADNWLYKFDKRSFNEINSKWKKNYSDLLIKVNDKYFSDDRWNNKPLKKIMEESAELFTTRYPVILANPALISTYFYNIYNIFDVVIFDESSQLRIQDSFPSLLRGKQIIVSGDKQQMPYKDLFKLKNVEDDTDTEEDNEDKGLSENQQSFIKDILKSESLIEMAENFKFINKRLSYHYRSEHPDLIGFSNSAFYENSLIALPEKRVYTPIAYCQIGGTYESQTNENEADYIVNEVLPKLMQHHFYKNRSIGIITFNEKQKDLLLQKISEKTEITDFLNRNTKEPYFIKSVNEVQGDERDIIILSTTFGKNGNKFSRNFGPLSKEKGKNILNVLVTRAKLKKIVVTSIPEKEFINYTGLEISKDGNYLLCYLCYAKFISEKSNDVDGLLKHIGKRAKPKEEIKFDSEFEMFVYEKLQADFPGQIKTQYPQSHYRIDIVYEPKNPGLKKLAIECDGARYHSGYNRRVQDRHRQSIIEDYGFKFYRILSTTWFDDDKVAYNKLRDFIKNYECSMPDTTEVIDLNNDVIFEVPEVLPNTYTSEENELSEEEIEEPEIIPNDNQPLSKSSIQEQLILPLATNNNSLKVRLKDVIWIQNQNGKKMCITIVDKYNNQNFTGIQEISKDQELGKQLLGKAIGETVNIMKNTWTILEIIPKQYNHQKLG